VSIVRPQSRDQQQVAQMTMATAAEELAIAGWAIFPCRNKKPLTPHGFKDATRDVEQVRRWWRQHPKAMIGMAIPRTLLITDIDPRNGGSLEKLISLCGELPLTLTVISGRGDGGMHLYFIRPQGLELNRSRLRGTGIDLKDSGLVILPPSVHPSSGQPYRWEDPEVKIAYPPLGLRQLLEPAPRRIRIHIGDGNGSGLVRTVLEADVGGRHDALLWAAFRARDDGILDDLEKELIDASVSTGYPEADARRVINSIPAEAE
jgi:hypothetical protein